MLLKLVLEPIIEPLGDETSFGFRPGRNCHQAVSYLANRLMFRRRKGLNRKRMQTSAAAGVSGYARVDLRNTGSVTVNHKGCFFSNPSLLDCDIEGCFDNISHEWLITNVPIPNDFKVLFAAILKAPIIGIDPEKEKIGSKCADDKTAAKLQNSGVPQGGIISRILMN